MYRLRDFLQSLMGLPPEAVPSDLLYCAQADLEHTLLTNKMQSSLACYTYKLVRQGWLGLFITTTHLSRIVRQITNHTVLDYINQMLLMEASWLLQSTDLSIAAIAERLHFANPSSFGKFFSRLKGTSPKAYRMQRLVP